MTVLWSREENYIVPGLFVCNTNQKKKTKLLRRFWNPFWWIEICHTVIHLFFFKQKNIFFLHTSLKQTCILETFQLGVGSAFNAADFLSLEKKYSSTFIIKNRVFLCNLLKKSFLKIRRSSITNCQCLAPAVSLAFILSDSKTNTEVWKVCTSSRAAQVVVEVRPADKMLVCVCIFWGKSQSCKQFGEDADDAEGSRGATGEREDVAEAGRRTGWSALLMVSSRPLSACRGTKCFKQSNASKVTSVKQSKAKKTNTRISA